MMEKTEKYNTCIHAESVGQVAVYVKPSCPQGTLIKGVFVSSKKRCEYCQEHKSRGDQ